MSRRGHTSTDRAAFRPTLAGGVVVVTGPDGVGKSRLADDLVAAARAGGRVRRFHHRIRVLPSSKRSRVPTSTPHTRPPYPRWLSYLKVLFLFLDEFLGRSLKVRPIVRRGGWVVIERGWWDLVVDPGRYRLRGVRRFTTLLGRLLPSPDAMVILEAPSAVIRGRKRELSSAEIERQVQSWRAVASQVRGSTIIDASQSPDALLADVLAACPMAPRARIVAASVASGWAALPIHGRPRWLIPTTSARSAKAGLSVHQPMTLSGRVGWEAARICASLGLFGVIRPSEDAVVTEAVEPFVPPGGSFSVAYGRESNRAVVLILDRSGQPAAVVKIGLGLPDRARLSREAELLHDLSPLLGPPLSAPKVIAAEAGVLVLEPVPWHPRLRPWRLPPDLAEAMGRFYANTLDGTLRHPAHGDFAPWNVLRTDSRWVLLDWENARYDSLPFADPFHYLVSAHTLLGHPDQVELLRGLNGEGWVGAALAAYMTGASITGGVRAAFVDYLRASTTELRPLHPHSARGRESRQRLLRALGRTG